jgi:cobalt-zinc-cadmium efflux system membrane fusion protein
MKKAFLTTLPLYLVLIMGYQSATAHGGEDHGEAKAPTGKAVTYFTSMAVSEKYELVLHYAPLEAGEAGTLQLYLNEFATNRPVNGATLQLSSPEDPKLTFTVKPIGPGIYGLTGIFPAKKAYSLTVNLNAKPGPDLFLLAGIEVGKELPVTGTDTLAVANAHWYESTYVLIGGGVLLGMVLMFTLMRVRNKRVIASLILVGCLLPTANWQPVTAHGGDDHGAAGGSGGAVSATFGIPKETQFIFNVLTVPLETGDQNQTTKIAGTILPSSTGQAVVQSPQIGRITALRVRVGQAVNRGQTLAIVEQTIDAATQINLQAERNNLVAEFQAAKQEYDRIKTIADIAAKRDVTEAEARFNKAQANLRVFTSIAQRGGGSARTITLTAPITGIVGTFSAAIGSTVNVGETVFTLTNLGKVYIEAQVFEQDLAVVRSAKSFQVEGANEPDKTATARLLSQAQTINTSNQSQRLLFEMDNAGGQFKIGEFVNVRVQSSKTTRGLVVPNSALSEINGKPVVFVKDAPEVFSMVYVNTGVDNGRFTQITSGVEADERVVVNATYPVKMIYLNQ